jgi:hypothetical protein
MILESSLPLLVSHPTRIELLVLSTSRPGMRAPKRIRKWRLPPEALGMSALAAALNGQSRAKNPLPDTKMPYVMWAGTPYGHLMIPVY